MGNSKVETMTAAVENKTKGNLTGRANKPVKKAKPTTHQTLTHLSELYPIELGDFIAPAQYKRLLNRLAQFNGGYDAYGEKLRLDDVSAIARLAPEKLLKFDRVGGAYLKALEQLKIELPALLAKPYAEIARGNKALLSDDHNYYLHTKLTDIDLLPRYKKLINKLANKHPELVCVLDILKFSAHSFLTTHHAGDAHVKELLILQELFINELMGRSGEKDAELKEIAAHYLDGFSRPALAPAEAAESSHYELNKSNSRFLRAENTPLLFEKIKRINKAWLDSSPAAAPNTPVLGSGDELIGADGVFLLFNNHYDFFTPIDSLNWSSACLKLFEKLTVLHYPVQTVFDLLSINTDFFAKKYDAVGVETALLIAVQTRLMCDLASGESLGLDGDVQIDKLLELRINTNRLDKEARAVQSRLNKLLEEDNAAMSAGALLGLDLVELKERLPLTDYLLAKISNLRVTAAEECFMLPATVEEPVEDSPGFFVLRPAHDASLEELDGILRADIEYYLQHFPDNRADIVRSKWGFSCERESMTDIARRFDLSLERIRQLTDVRVMVKNFRVTPEALRQALSTHSRDEWPRLLPGLAGWFSTELVFFIFIDRYCRADESADT